MNNKTKMFSNPDLKGEAWSEVTNRERNQLVFERLNKSYGAYEIRSNYDRTLLKSFYLVILITLFIVGVSLFSSKIKPIIPIIPDTSAIRLDPPIFELPETPSVELPRNPISSPKNPNIFSQPVVTSDSIPKEDTTQSLVININNPPGNSNDPDNTNLSASIRGTDDIDKEPTKIRDSIYLFVSERPEFPGGDKELFNFLRSNTRVPESIINAGRGINEKIGVVFIVDKDGSVTAASLFQGGSRYAELNNEALRVINKMPKWEPGKQNGNKVKVRMFLPFRFEVKN